MYPAMIIADYIISKGGGKLTPLQVIKLVYIAHGYTHGLLGGPLIREPVEAWKFGPVVPVVYHALKHYGGDPVPELYYCETKLGSSDMDDRRKLFGKVIRPIHRQIINKVVEEYGYLTAKELMDTTHEPDTPWSKYYEKDTLNVIIPETAIKEHYQQIAQVRNAPAM